MDTKAQTPGDSVRAIVNYLFIAMKNADACIFASIFLILFIGLHLNYYNNQL